LTKLTEPQAVPPIKTDSPVKKFEPVILMVVPPVVGPKFGVTELTVGAKPFDHEKAF
jgi:hypothetical protein